MSEGNGGNPPKLSYLERMKRIREREEAKRAAQGFGSIGTSYASSTASNPSISTTAATGDDKENAAHCLDHKDESLLHESQMRANKSAPAGDVSQMGNSILSTTSLGGGAGDELQRSTYSVGDNSSVTSNVSRNTSGGSSVIDVPRDGSLHHNSILNSFMREEQPSKLESFSRPRVPRSRGNSEAEVEVNETFDMNPPPSEQHASAPHHQQQHQQQHDRYARAAAVNGSMLRSKSAASAFEPMFATPAISRNTGILSGLMPRTPAFQTPSRLSMSALSLASTQRMIIKDKEYAIISSIGKGGSSQVYQAFDDMSGSTVAIKVVDLSDVDDASREAFVNEVELLKKLQGSRHVIKMFDYELVEEEDQLLVVMEKGETDLGTYLKTRRNEMTPAFIKFWWEEMLQAVKFVHEHKVVHMDLKPANFLLVSGNLKLIDFGIASSIPSDKTSLLKESQMGTLSYMSPEALIVAELEEGEEEGDGGSKYKVTAKSDVWSLGCILYTMVYGRRPFDQFRQMNSKMQAIRNPNTQIFYESTDDPMIVDVLRRCLVHDAKKRASVAELLEHPYLKSSGSDKNSTKSASTPIRSSPISDESLARLAHKMQSYTPRTMENALKQLVKTAAQSNRPRTTLELDSPPSTK